MKKKIVRGGKKVVFWKDVLSGFKLIIYPKI